MGEKTVFGKHIGAAAGDRPLREKRCENCTAFDEGDLPRKPSTCRAVPPHMIMGTGPMGQGIGGMWVPTTKEDWCLKHEPKIN